MAFFYFNNGFTQISEWDINRKTDISHINFGI